uniref:septum site-determining protein MinC n=1 Tax=Thaumasiovibrio occultus TaxID=1891184 RepID=UPI000B35B99C|nr:septum site-determining protein MinC [Thaumasiovibrio occultus]
MSKIAELKGSSFTLSVLHLLDNDEEAITQFLNDKVNSAPAFFSSAPVIIDISRCGSAPDFDRLKDIVTESGMILVGISGCPPFLKQNAVEAGLAIMTPAREAKTREPEMEPTRVITTPVRSGQQIYAKNADLVILNHVSAGAEVIADGSIHIYGTLRGRAIAGASGQKEARIFCKNLQPELISICGNYWLSDKITSDFWGTQVQVSLEGDNLMVRHLVD